MRIGVPAEVRAGETRVAATPDTVKRLAAKNEVRIQAGAGAGSSIRDSDFAAAGAKVVGSAAEAYDAEIVLKVRAPTDAELDSLKSNSILVGLLDPFNAAGIEALARRGVTAFAMEWLPRISRAQSMDVLSSQANIGGYKAVILAAAEYGRFMPMLMTAAGTVKAARVLVLGAGVAGLQAIATAKRLGAVIEASDVRPAVKEQVESLGAKFLDVPYETDEEREIAQGVGGYAHQGRDRQGDETRRGDRRSRGRAGRQCRGHRARQDGGEARRQADRAGKPAGDRGDRRLRLVRAQPLQLPGPDARPEERRVQAGSRRRDHRRHAAVYAGRSAQERLTMGGLVDPTVINLVVFVLAVFVGYHVIWNVTPALHTPLMSLTNAISSVIIVGAILAAAPTDVDLGSVLGVIAVALASVNVAGGFLVTQRMLQMFRKKQK